MRLKYFCIGTKNGCSIVRVVPNNFLVFKNNKGKRGSGTGEDFIL